MSIAVRLRRHPIPMRAWFEHSLVVTWAYPREVLAPLLPPGLEVDDYEGHGFLAVAVVKTQGLRPQGWPAWTGTNAVFTGYRVFARMRTSSGHVLRGLRIVRSDVSHRAIALSETASPTTGSASAAPTWSPMTTTWR